MESVWLQLMLVPILALMVMLWEDLNKSVLVILAHVSIELWVCFQELLLLGVLMRKILN